MEQEQVYKVLLPSHFQAMLSAHKGEGSAHFCQESANALDQALL